MTIRNDATRARIPVKEARPLRGVVARQGQVLLDTDVNELARTALDRVETADAAMLGPPDRLLYPAGTSGFAVSGTLANCTIAPGTGYLKGWQLVNAAASPVTLLNQPNPWKGAAPAPSAVVVLKALVRHIDPAEDPALADVALGDAQASGRALNDWQAFLLHVPAGTDCPAVTSVADWQALVAPSTGTLAFQIPAPPASSDPCSLTPAGGHSRFENLLYRIEVHGSTAAGTATADGPRFKMAGLKLKLSRRNASLMARIVKISDMEITVSPPALDPRAWFEKGCYAEIVGPGDDIDPAAALAKERLFKVDFATDEVITLAGVTGDVTGTGVQANNKWFLRMWDAWPDGAGTCTVPANGGPVDLGDGISILLGGGATGIFRRGDYWTAAVRADGSVAWPGTAQQTPHGPEIRYAPLGIFSAGAAGNADCRIPFATLSDRALLYRGGDGQEAFAPEVAVSTAVTLPRTLRLAVMRGATPVPGARVRWRMPAGGIKSWIAGSDISVNPFESVTDANGLAEVTWAIDAKQQAVPHAVEAVLIEGNQPANTPAIRYAAQFATAARTSYKPGTCPTLAGSTDVQGALDALCAALDEREPETIRLRKITLLGLHDRPTELIKGPLILNALPVEPNALVDGIRFEFDPVQLDIAIETHDPVAEITIELPYPTTDTERFYWRWAVDPNQEREGSPMSCFGFQTIRLDGLVAVRNGNVLEWKPSGFVQRFLLSAINHRFGAVSRDVSDWRDPVLDYAICRIRLRSALIFADSPKTKKRIWLNAEHLGTRDTVTGRELLLEARDPQKAGDLDMFICLRVPEPGIIFFYPKASAAPDRSNLGTVDNAVNAVLDHWNEQRGPVHLAAYADEPGTKSANLALSQQRAAKIRALLTAKGIPTSTITIAAFGSDELPRPPGHPKSIESLNRRVAVTFPVNGKP